MCVQASHHRSVVRSYQKLFSLDEVKIVSQARSVRSGYTDHDAIKALGRRGFNCLKTAQEGDKHVVRSRDLEGISSTGAYSDSDSSQIISRVNLPQVFLQCAH